MTDERVDNPQAGQPTEQPWYAEMVLSPLLAAARAACVGSVRRELAAAGLSDLPPRGPFVVGAMASLDAACTEALTGLHLAPSAQERLLDGLVARGYLAREGSLASTDALVLTDRGRAAAAATRDGVAAVEEALVARVGPEAVASMRATLGALVELGDEWQQESGDAGAASSD